VIVLGLFGLAAIGVIGTGAFLVHKARRAGFDADLFRRNPGLAIGRIIAATHPDMDVVDTDDGAGRVTLRDRRTGKRFSMTFDAARNGSFRMQAEDEDGKTGSLELGAGAKLPSWVPQYPGSQAAPVFSAKGDSDDGGGEAGNLTFQTDDPASKVLSFYADKAKELGMTLERESAGERASVTASDDAGRFLKAIAIGGAGQTIVNVTYGRKR
jgi:hypothetical protein